MVHFILWSQNFQEPWTPWSWLKTKTTTKIRGWTKPLRTTAQAGICSQAIAPFAPPGALPQLPYPVLNRAKPSLSQPFCEALPCRVGRAQLCLCPRRPLVQTSLTSLPSLPQCVLVSFEQEPCLTPPPLCLHLLAQQGQALCKLLNK